MSTTFGAFIHTLVSKSRGGGVVELEYDVVSGCCGVDASIRSRGTLEGAGPCLLGFGYVLYLCPVFFMGKSI